VNARATLVSSVSGLLSEQLAALLRRKLAPAAFREALEKLILASRPAVEATFVDTILAGWLSGAAAGAEMLTPGPILAGWKVPPGEPPAGELLYPAGAPEPVVRLAAIEAAAEHLRDRAIFSSHDFYALQAGARQQAFTISANVTEQTLDKVNELLAELTAEAPSLAEFRERVLAAVPGLPIGEAHLEQVYRNSVNEAYSQGHERVLEHPLVADEFPYRLYVAIHDERARPEHRALEFLGIDGTAVYYKNDPTWVRFRAPWSWNCRCGWIALSVEDAASYGVREAQEWLATGVEPAHPPVARPPFDPDPRWERASL
jgi:hypothetical protein